MESLTSLNPFEPHQAEIDPFANLRIYQAGLVDSDLVLMLVYQLLGEQFALTKEDERKLVNFCFEILAEDSNFMALLALDGLNRPIAVMTITESIVLNLYGKVGIIVEHFVVPEGRGRGVGRRLVEKAEELAVDKAWKQLHVLPIRGELIDKSREFYHSLGFKPLKGYMVKQLS